MLHLHRCGQRIELFLGAILPRDLHHHLPAFHMCIEFGAKKEGATELSVERVRLRWWWRESFAQHDGDLRPNTLGDGLVGEVVWTGRCRAERLA